MNSENIFKNINLNEMIMQNKTCDDCYLAMRNCMDMRICCNKKDEPCDQFVPLDCSTCKYSYIDDECEKILCNLPKQNCVGWNKWVSKNSDERAYKYITKRRRNKM